MCISAGVYNVCGAQARQRALRRGAGVMAGNPARCMGQDRRFVYHMLLLCHRSLTRRQSLLTREAAELTGSRAPQQRPPLIKNASCLGGSAATFRGRGTGPGRGASLRKRNNFLYIHYDETFGSPLCARVMQGH